MSRMVGEIIIEVAVAMMLAILHTYISPACLAIIAAADAILFLRTLFSLFSSNSYN